MVYGAALPGQHGNVLQLVANRLRNNEEVFVVSDQWRTPTFVGDVSQGVEKLISHPQNGIYHLCGSECLTIADIGLSGSGRIGAESLAHPSRHHEGDERKDTTSPFQRAEYRKGTPGTGVSTAYAGGRNKADVRMVNNAGADGSRLDYSNSGSASPFSLRYTRTISRITSPYFSTPLFPKYGIRTSMALSEGSRLLMPRIAFC